MLLVPELSSNVQGSAGIRALQSVEAATVLHLSLDVGAFFTHLGFQNQEVGGDEGKWG